MKKESDLYPIIKNYFKERGYVVYAEVAHYLRGIDLVAISETEHIAVELKLRFNYDVVRQASWNRVSFNKSYICFFTNKPKFFHDYHFDKLTKMQQELYCRLENEGIGILEVLPSGTIFEALKPKEQNPHKRIDFTHHKESEDDLGGLPCQKGVSAGYYELECIKDYVRKYPNATWREIYANVHTHYSNHNSLAGAMSQWRGFNLRDFKNTLNK